MIQDIEFRNTIIACAHGQLQRRTIEAHVIVVCANGHKPGTGIWFCWAGALSIMQEQDTVRLDDVVRILPFIDCKECGQEGITEFFITPEDLLYIKDVGLRFLHTEGLRLVERDVVVPVPA